MTSEGKTAGYNGESFAMLFNCICTVADECEMWRTRLQLKKCTNISENCIIKNGGGALAPGGPLLSGGPWKMFAPHPTIPSTATAVEAEGKDMEQE